jgi:pyrophosphatase PpaX
MARPWEAVLFDLDGTLLDSIELIVRAFQHTTLVHLGAPVTRARIVPTIGRSLLAVLDELAPGRSAELLPTYDQFVRDYHDQLAVLVPSCAPVLAELRTRGYALGIVTAKRWPVARLAFDAHGLDRLVDVIVCLEDTARSKPAPDPLLLAADRLGLAPAACLYVGDSVHDLLAAHAAGMASAAALWGPNDPAELAARTPTHLCHALTDLLTLVG